MKKLALLIIGCVSLTSCGTYMQGNPAAISIGASVGGSLGSIIGGSSDDYRGYAIGNIIGTIAGAAVGAAVSTPHNTTGGSSDNNGERRVVRSRADNNASEEDAALPLVIENIRFVDANNDHAIQANEDCKLVFDMYNDGNSVLYNVYPRITVNNSNVGISNPAIIDKLEGGQRLRYTAAVYGYSALREGKADFVVTACQQGGRQGDVHRFTLDTQR